MPFSNATLDPRTINLLRQILDEVWDALPDNGDVDKSEIARRLLTLASEGERDPSRLRAAALGERV